MAKNGLSIKSFGKGWFFQGGCEEHWSIFKYRRPDLQPRGGIPRTLWSITRTHDEDGNYRGSAIIRGYEVTSPQSQYDDPVGDIYA